MQSVIGKPDQNQDRIPVLSSFTESIIATLACSLLHMGNVNYQLTQSQATIELLEPKGETPDFVQTLVDLYQSSLESNENMPTKVISDSLKLSLKDPVSRASLILSNTPRNRHKMAAREVSLLAYPEKRININTARLHQIIDYTNFFVHPQCSIARNAAVRGSDIDRGLVVTKESVSTGKQQEFVNELRSQGFSCNTQAELEKSNVSSLDKRIKLQLEVITFKTIDEIKHEENLESWMITYIGGKDIG
jgi:hypothetical protein